MNRSVLRRQIAGFLFTGVCGTLLHFLFDWTGGSAATALFSAANESVWEHMKLLLYPMFLFALWESRRMGDNVRGFWQVKLSGILLGLILIPALYYTYTGALGVSADWFNITIFFLADAAAYAWETCRFRKGGSRFGNGSGAFAVLCLLSLLFPLLTFLPPRIPLFQDPVTGTYGFFAQ